ncbi:multidrug efflux SMR transporter [Pontibacillus sp. ALD_SL1]|uniref:DMT family transporter n=1 Tax=Pontibacillus sp. ALD_SL1 TaxID=2777185 RepID=UPI001A956B4E|nr:multidrug efflux SMR transporter [Pontibacillus sp. ALD_SL1]QST01019.1 multidrug efflux SMR transporter [Pontibacillus sp. ALD_SL1]
MGYLVLSLVLATMGNISVKLSSGFQRLFPSVTSFVFIGACLYFLTMSVQTIEVGVAYAIWGGASIVATTLFGILLFNERASGKKFIFISFIVLGIVIIK